jgi:branched-subunit amino acid transport protein AzlD
LRNIEFLKGNFGIPELIATGLVIVLHSWKKNILLTVAVSTILYMIMVQFLDIAALML